MLIPLRGLVNAGCPEVGKGGLSHQQQQQKLQQERERDRLGAASMQTTAGRAGWHLTAPNGELSRSNYTG